MACERNRDALADVAAGLPAPSAVEAHLASCEACRAELRALRQALAVADAEMAGVAVAEPSAGLAARIRQVAAEAAPSPGGRFGWLWPATAAAAALLVALAVVLGRGTSPAPEPRVAVDAPRPMPTDRPPPAELSSPVTPRISIPVGPRAVRTPDASLGNRRPGVPRQESPEPQVLVPPGEREALLRLVALVHRERMALPGLGAAGEPSVDLAEPAPIDIPPLEIVPLDPAEGSGT